MGRLRGAGDVVVMKRHCGEGGGSKGEVGLIGESETVGRVRPGGE